MDDDGLAVEIPLILTPTTDKQREKTPKKRKKSTISSDKKSFDSRETTTCASVPSPTDELSRITASITEHRKKSAVGGSLKYDIGRERSSVIGFPVKWSSVRIKGTGYEDSTKVKVEPCNGMPLGMEYDKLLSPTTGTPVIKNNIGNVSILL